MDISLFFLSQPRGRSRESRRLWTSASLAATVTAAGELWEPRSYTSPFGGRINGITIAPDGSVYLTSRFGLHRTADGGKTWKAIKSTCSTSSFDRLAANLRSEVWGAMGDTSGCSVVRLTGN